MPDFLKAYYDTEGPFGIPMKDRQALALEAKLRELPQELRALRKAVVARAPTETLEGERSDVSWISTEDPDRDREVVLARGMDDAHFRLNPIVTMQHAYWLPPVGKSLWRRRVKDGSLHGVKAKTQYPHRPDSWPEAADWPADTAFTLVQARLLNGKSIGFLPTKVHVPDDKERQRHGWHDVRLVIDEWVLLEYACVFLTVKPKINGSNQPLRPGANKALRQLTHEHRRKRGGGTAAGPVGVYPIGPNDEAALVQVMGDETTPEFAAQVADEYRRLLDLLGGGLARPTEPREAAPPAARRAVRFHHWIRVLSPGPPSRSSSPGPPNRTSSPAPPRRVSSP